MEIIQNLHTHTAYCDGKNTPREIISYAIDKKFLSIGFSGHSYVPFDEASSMSLERTKQYKNELTLLKHEYENIIKIYIGIEYDLHSNVDISEYDYSIGAMHYFKFGDDYFAVDGNAEYTQMVINNFFHGDAMKFVKAYYEGLTHLTDHGKIDILAHIDLVTKNLDRIKLFDDASKIYLSYAFEAINALKGRVPFFEVNTGAMARGYRNSPYPSLLLTKELRRQGYRAIISTDCHDALKLDYKYNDAVELLRLCGFKERYILTDDGFVAVPL